MYQVKRNLASFISEAQSRHVFREIQLQDISTNMKKEVSADAPTVATVDPSFETKKRAVIVSEDTKELTDVQTIEELSFLDCPSATSIVASLAHFDWIRLSKLCLDGFSTLTDNLLLEMTQSLNNLKVLRINRCPSLTSRAVSKLLSNNVGIIDLDLSLMPKLEDSTLADGISRLKRLQQISLDASPKLGASCSSALANNCEFLTNASFSGSATFDTLSFNLITTKCPLLRELAIGSCELVSLTENLENLHVTAKSLQTLDISQIAGVAPGVLDAVRSRGLTVIYRPKITAWTMPRLLPDAPPAKVKEPKKKEAKKGGKKGKKK